MPRLSTGVMAAVVCCVAPSIYAGWRIVGGGPLVSGGWCPRKKPPPPMRLAEDDAATPMASATRTCIGKRSPHASARERADESILVSLSAPGAPYLTGGRATRVHSPDV